MGHRADVEERVTEALRAAGEPVREAVLYERVRDAGARIDAEVFVAVLERLATRGHVRMAVEHDLPTRDPEPFAPRFWSIVGRQGPSSMRERVRVEPGSRVDLADVAPDARMGLSGREEADSLASDLGDRLAGLGALLAADRRQALLVVFQGLDASGKDGAIKRCIGPLNPMMVRTAAFTAPSAEERSHDFLWRVHARLPARGQVGAFNRSHYEDVLVPRVEGGVAEQVWGPRHDAITGFERHLAQEGTTVLKFFLHISREEQERRFEARIADPHKRWKFDPADLAKRELRDDYMDAYADLLERTSTDWAPWHVVPADHKWVRDVVVMQVMAEVLESLDLRWPDLDPEVARVVGR